jgi:hypothetical protein
MTASKYYVGVIVDSGPVIVEANEGNNSTSAGSTTNVKSSCLRESGNDTGRAFSCLR